MKLLVPILIVMLAACPGTIASFIIRMVNNEVNTYIDVSTQIAFVSRKIVVENVVSEKIKNYTYIVDDFWSSNLAYIEATDSRATYLEIVKDESEHPLLKYAILFDDALYPSTIETLSISTVFIGVVENRPRKIKQYETHSVLFKLNVFFYSDYFTIVQTTVVYTGNNQVSYVDGSQFKITNDSNSKHALQYGPYHNEHARSSFVSSIHFETTSSFLVVDRLDRFVQISHWGFVQITDRISLAHAGPELEGPFERPFKEEKPDVTKVDYFMTTLPRYAFDVSLKDDIGMISSFTVDESDERKVDVEIRPRFVLYGGWKTYYELSYTLPIKHHLIYEDDTFSLTLPLVDRVFRNLVVKDAQFHYVLPEGAVLVDVEPHTELDNNTRRHCNVLDTVCRDVVSFKRQGLFHRHTHSKVRLTYKFPQYLLLTKPLTVASCIFLALLCVVCFTRFCSNNEAHEARMHKAGRKHTDLLPRLIQSDPVISKNSTKNVKDRPKKHVNRK